MFRFSYMLSVNVWHAQYDLGIKNVSSAGLSHEKIMALDRNYVKKNGNLEYLIHVYKTGQMLDSNSNQGYHPPFHHYITATVMRFCDLFGASDKFKLEAAEFPAFVYSIIILFVIYKIARELDLKDEAMILVMALSSFNPLLIYMSRLINNDPLVTLCTSITVLYLIRWYKEPKLKNTLALALAVGLGASSKVSIVVMIIPLLVTYFKKLHESVEDTKLVKNILIYGLIFSVVSAPLVFWYQIRNAIKFNQMPFGVVTALEDLKVENTDFVNRWLINKEWFTDKLYYNASNVWAYVINSSILFVMDVAFLNFTLLTSMRIVTIALAVIFVGSIIKNLKEDFSYKILIITVLTWLISFIHFNNSMPYSCTMHARYIPIIFIIAILFIAKLYEKTEDKSLKLLIKILSILYVIGTISIILKLLYIF